MANWIYKGSTFGNSGSTITDTGFDFHAPVGGSLGDLFIVWFLTDCNSALDVTGLGSIGVATATKTGWNALYADIVPIVSGPPLQAILAGKLFYPDTDTPSKNYHVGFGSGTGAWAWATELWSGSAQLTRFQPLSSHVTTTDRTAWVANVDYDPVTGYVRAAINYVGTHFENAHVQTADFLGSCTLDAGALPGFYQDANGTYCEGHFWGGSRGIPASIGLQFSPDNGWTEKAIVTGVTFLGTMPQSPTNQAVPIPVQGPGVVLRGTTAPLGLTTSISFGSADDSSSSPPETDSLLLVAAGLGAGGQVGGPPTLCNERVRSDGAYISLSLSDQALSSDVSAPGSIAITGSNAPWITVSRMSRSFEYNNDLVTAGAPVLTGAATSTNTVDLSWTPAATSFGLITEYDILRDDGAGGLMLSLATVLGTMLTYHDQTAAYGKTYNYQVFGKASGISGALSNTVSVTTPGSAPVFPPSIPTGLRYTLNNGAEVDLVWNPSVPGSSAITGYTIYQDGVPVGTSVHPSYHDLSVQPATTYTYTVDCYDANGAQSGQSLPLSVTTPNIGPDVTPPSVPTALVATPVSGTQINLTWTASTDPDSPALGYTVYRDTNPVGAVTGTSFADHGLTPVTLYTYNVDAYDPAGNHSAQSPNATATTLADTAPSAPTGLAGFANGPYGVYLTWTAAAVGTHAVAGYTVLRDAVVLGTTTALKFTDVTCDPARTYVYTVQAYDTIGLVSAASSGLSLTTQSTLWTPPKVWELSDPATSLELNTYGRDNLLHLKGTGWTSFTYLNSFTGYHGDAQYCRKGPWIYLQGMVAGPANNTICTRLAPGFCPLREVVKIVWGRIGVSNVGPMRVNILPTGDVVIGGGVGLAGAVTYCSLNQICFSQDGR